jgi:hypothetical protein
MVIRYPTHINRSVELNRRYGMTINNAYNPKVIAKSVLKRHKEYRETEKRERISTQQKFLDASNEYLGDKKLEKEGKE